MKNGVKSKETRLFFSSNKWESLNYSSLSYQGFCPYLSLIYVAQRKLLVYQ